MRRLSRGYAIFGPTYSGLRNALLTCVAQGNQNTIPENDLYSRCHKYCRQIQRRFRYLIGGAQAIAGNSAQSDVVVPAAEDRYGEGDRQYDTGGPPRKEKQDGDERQGGYGHLHSSYPSCYPSALSLFPGIGQPPGQG